MRQLIPPAATIAALLSGCTASEADTQPPSATTGTATAILNAGVTAEIGTAEAPAKFLFDPLYDDHFGSLEQLDDALIERIVSGEAPYDGVTAVFVSHAHGDHFSASQLTRLMAAQPSVRLVAPTQAVEQMRSDGDWNATFAARIKAISLENGEQATSFEIDGARVEAFRSPHSGWPDRHADVHNITFRVTAPAGQTMLHRVMHMGDADPGTEFYEPHAEFLSSVRTGLVIVPFWFFSEDDAEALVDGMLNAEAAVGMHVPAKEPSWLAGSGWDYFSGEGQEVTVPEVKRAGQMDM